MNKIIYLTIFGLFTFLPCTKAQQNYFSGSWQTENLASKKNETLRISISIAAPYAQVLYPALLKINYQNFNISYQMLLVQNHKGQLLVAQNKIPAGEFPFSLKNANHLLAGYLAKTNSGSNKILRLNLTQALEPNFTPIKGMDSLADIAHKINKLLSRKEIKFKQTNTQPWQSPTLTEIIHSANSGNYYGFTDSLVSNKNNISLKLVSSAANDKRFSAWFDKQYLFEEEMPKNFNYTFTKTLTEGPNYICFFADDFPLQAKDSAALWLNYGDKLYRLNFADAQNWQAGFIVACIYYEPEYKEKPAAKIIENQPADLLRNTLLIDSFYTEQQTLTLAIWDDALQDGDSISLSVNGTWILQHKLVTISPQFFTITVQPGVNNMVFIANNLGSIPPNTSILEIIDNRQRKAFHINTNLRKNNLVKIIYEVPK